MDGLSAILSIVATVLGFVVTLIYRNWKKKEAEEKRKREQAEEAAEANERNSRETAENNEGINNQREAYEEWKNGGKQSN